nr:MAG TPA: hypothetical protein [Caudoviricetes sp.]
MLLENSCQFNFLVTIYHSITKIHCKGIKNSKFAQQ